MSVGSEMYHLNPSTFPSPLLPQSKRWGSPHFFLELLKMMGWEEGCISSSARLAGHRCIGILHTSCTHPTSHMLAVYGRRRVFSRIHDSCNTDPEQLFTLRQDLRTHHHRPAAQARKRRDLLEPEAPQTKTRRTLLHERSGARWRNEQTTLWKAVAEATRDGGKRRRKTNTSVRDLLADERCIEAVLAFLSSTSVGMWPNRA
ncbi:hypothetical protein FN846DRAFT_84718 [Sphaerosporella brunnea]|uniref:Uncharacterized protein n=1 Tax=Sphaerosporella brunnea TaxID=1250544 RepID=A0A5J5ETM3_9PEZI|nr:hypothetical protein FN846DRAFT_84718 [Sphaerosporella brunnea]